MKLLSAALPLLLVLATSAAAAPLRRPPGSFHPGEVLVLVADPASLALDASGAVTARDAALQRALERHALTRGERLGAAPAPGASWLFRLLSARPDFDPFAAARDLAASGAVRAACPDLRVPVLSTLPNDPLLADQWYVYQASPRADIHLPEAWDLEKGSASTVIAIVDMGVDLGHPDLASRIWTNPGEIPGNGVDDDGDGLVDDVHGWDFGDGDNDPDPGPIFDPLYGIDIGFHGTMCAGFAAAATNNATGIAGAGWNCRILPIRAADPDSELSIAAVAAGIEYAAALHAHVLSMSFGDTSAAARTFFQALVDDARAAGVICVAAAGNDDDSTRVYPAACDGVISVGATDDTNARAYFSNWGPWVKVAAPGATMLSTLCRNYPIDEGSQFWYELFFGWDGVNPYMYGDGTSFACPLVAGVCGLLHSHLPSLAPDAAEQILIASGDVVPYDRPIGRKVNAWHALQQAVVAVDPSRASLPIALAAAPNPSSAVTRLWLTLPDAASARVTILDVAGRNVRELADGTFAAGRHPLAWDGRNASGRRVAGGVYFARVEANGRAVTTRLVRLER